MKSTTAVLAGWSARVLVVGCSLVNTRLLLNMLDVPAYAVYAIVLSLGPWFNLLALGVPNMAQNTIARYRAEGVDYSELKTSVVNAALVGATVALMLCWPVGWAVRHTVLAGHEGVTASAVALMSFGLCLTALTPVFNQVLLGLHRGLWPNVMPGLQSLVTTGMLLALEHGSYGGLDWAVASFVLPALLTFAILAVAAGAAPRYGINLRQLRQMLVDSRHFLLFGVLSTGALSADYVVMAFTLSSSDIVEYNLASKVFTVLLTVHAVVLSNSWSVLSDHHYSGNVAGLRRRVGWLLLVGMLVVLTPAIAVLALHDEVFGLISGGRMVRISMVLLVLWPIYLLIRVWCDTFALAHMSAGRVKIMNAYVVFQSVLSIGGQIWLGHYYGPAGILSGIILSFLLTAAWILPLHFLKVTCAPQP